MDMRESQELSDFRLEVREFVKVNYKQPEDIWRNYKGLGDRGEGSEWFGKLAEKGWLAFRWPKKYGGAELTPPQQVVFIDELMNQQAPLPQGFGLNMVGPLILQFGTEEQKDRFLRPIATNEENWCQGYSEPNSGSDLASLQTRAELDGEEFIVNGQKIWTSRAYLADWIFCLVRTDPGVKKQLGISFLLMDMKTPGLTIKRIDQIDGRASFCETFFDNVRVPAKNIIGKINEGWTVAKALLGHERMATSDVRPLVERVKTLARHYERGDKPILEDSGFRNRLVQLEMDDDCLRYTRYRLNTALMQGKAPGPESSIFKLFQSELSQHLYDLGMEAMGIDGSAWYEESLIDEAYHFPMGMTINRAYSIFSGTSEVQRNIIAKRVLGLPD